MKIDFNNMTSNTIKNYKDGPGELLSKVVYDGNRKIMIHTIKKDSGIGYHYHDLNEEFVFVLKGIGTVKEDKDISYKIYPGDACLIHRQHGHSIINEDDEDLEILSLVG